MNEYSTAESLFRLITNKKLAPHFFKTARLIRKNFFSLQNRARRHPNLIPVVNVDHPLDKTIPFHPKWAMTYHDFSAFWIRTAARLSREASPEAAADFITSMGDLYIAAAEVYTRHMSTTRRPRSFANIGCVAIQLFDPHLLCVPSLHVMVCVHTWIKARQLLETAAQSPANKTYIERLFDHAVFITESILYMKQHSVNCIPAALYAMTCFEPDIFTRKDAAIFTAALFKDERNAQIAPVDRAAIRAFVETSYAGYMQERENLLAAGNSDWTAPLIAFLKSCP
ncbi:MAG: hypothetical protein LBK61_08775 [Spirochaetaceae bacterium]|jgi:hypothetical protein|nr:hypothetical protein [Spirochaetaceae bacterium]